MKYILTLGELTQLNESYFAKGDDFEKYREKALLIMDKLVDQYQYSPKLAAALVGNMFKESKFNPNVGTSHIGIIQWGSIGQRKEKLLKLPNWNTLDGQLKYIDIELNGAYSKVKKLAEEAATVEQAAEIIARKYEVCSDPTHPQRINSAKEIYDIYNSEKSSKLSANINQ